LHGYDKEEGGVVAEKEEIRYRIKEDKKKKSDIVIKHG